MEGAPYALVEAMTIAGYAIGAAHGCSTSAASTPARTTG